MRSTIGIDVAAPAELVLQLARDVERWPQLLPHYAAATPIGPGTMPPIAVVAPPMIMVCAPGVPFGQYE